MLLGARRLCLQGSLGAQALEDHHRFTKWPFRTDPNCRAGFEALDEWAASPSGDRSPGRRDRGDRRPAVRDHRPHANRRLAHPKPRCQPEACLPTPQPSRPLCCRPRFPKRYELRRCASQVQGLLESVRVAVWSWPDTALNSSRLFRMPSRRRPRASVVKTPPPFPEPTLLVKSLGSLRLSFGARTTRGDRFACFQSCRSWEKGEDARSGLRETTRPGFMP